jgi:hypothetical protein
MMPLKPNYFPTWFAIRLTQKEGLRLEEIQDGKWPKEN